MPWVTTEVIGLDYWGRPIYRNLEAEMATNTQEWMCWHPRSKEEAEAQRRCLKYLLHVTREHPFALLGREPAHRRVVEEQLIGREQVRDEAEALLRYIEENWS